MGSGRFVYERAGAAMLQESWRSETRADGAVATIAERDAAAFGAFIAVEAIAQAGRPGTFAFSFHRVVGEPVMSAAEYRVRADGIDWRRPGEEWRLAAAGPAHFFPLMRVFTGDMVRAIERAGGQASVVTPSLGDTADPARLFEPLESVRTVRRDPADADAHLLSGGPYEAPARIRLDARGLLERYDWTPGDGVAWTCRRLDEAVSSSA